MSRAQPPSTGKPYGLAQVNAAWGMPRSSCYCPASSTEPSLRVAQVRPQDAVDRQGTDRSS